MGLTISYGGRLKSPKAVQSLIAELTDIAQSMDWPYEVVDYDWELPDTSFIDEQGRMMGHTPLKGIKVKLHPRCDPFSLLFDPKGNVRNRYMMALLKDSIPHEFVKTQFAPVEVHTGLVKLMKYLESAYFEQLEVEDPSGYWDTQDQQLLEQEHGFLGEVIAQVTQAVDTSLQQPLSEEEDLTQRLEGILRTLKIQRDPNSGTMNVPGSPMGNSAMNWSANRISTDPDDNGKKKKNKGD